MSKARNRIIFLITILSFAMISALFAQGEELKTIIVKEGQGPRDIAQEALGEPDLWNEILKANQLNSPSDLFPGMKLVIPAGAIKRSSRELENARQAIQMATDVGARVFTAEIITQAVALYDDAVKARKEGNWDACTRLALEAHQTAEKSHQETLEKRNTTADAIVTDRSGTVQSKEAAEMIWRDLSLYSKLFENNRVRTLSNSYAEISFQDQSRIRLNENSQAMIQKMRVDLLNKERDSIVKLEKGAAFALLQTNQKKKKFNLNIPGVKTEINSKNFWVQKDEKVTKIANYEGEIKLSSDESSVVISENQGSQIAADGEIGKSKELLHGTELLAPANNAILAGGSIVLQWQPVKQAQRYLLQVSADYSFKNIVVNREDITTDSYTIADLKDGAYYWIVAAFDKEGFPGPSSPRGFFYVFSDTGKPFLYVNHPQEQDIFKTDTLHITGETEAEVQLFVNGQEEALQGGGAFQLTHQLSEGINKLVITAKDRGGNETKIERTVMYAANPEIQISYDAAMKQLEPKQFFARGGTLDVRGSTIPLSSVTIQNPATSLTSRAFADAAGHFQISLLDISESRPMILTVLTPTGYQKNDTLYIRVSTTSPQIILNSTIPAVAAEESLLIQGAVEHATQLRCNDVPVPIVDGRFAHTIRLTPGANVIKLVAADDMENTSLIQSEIFLDKTPPELVNYSLMVKSGAADDIVEVRVKAKDGSGLKRSARVELQAGEMVNSGYLLYNSASQMYEASFKYPKGAGKTVKLKSLVLEDYYGNQNVLHPN